MIETASAVIIVERHPQRLDRYALSPADSGHVLADFDDFGRKFVAEDLRQSRSGELMFVDRRDDRAGRVFMEVGAANAARLWLDKDLFGSRTCRRRNVLDSDV